MSSLDQSLRRMGLEHVDIFYHHRPDPDTPLEETARALDHIVRSGRALYAGISSYSAELTVRMQALMRELGTPLLIHQPSYSMLNRWIEAPGRDGTSLLGALTGTGMGSIVFTPLAQGMLTDRYLDGVPADSRAAAEKSLDPGWLSATTLERIRGLHEIAAARGQSLAQMALAWVLREQEDGQVTTALVGASSPGQLEENVGAVRHLGFTPEELAAIDRLATDSDIDIWAGARESKHA